MTSFNRKYIRLLLKLKLIYGFNYRIQNDLYIFYNHLSKIIDFQPQPLWQISYKLDYYGEKDSYRFSFRNKGNNQDCEFEGSFRYFDNYIVVKSRVRLTYVIYFIVIPMCLIINIVPITISIFDSNIQKAILIFLCSNSFFYIIYLVLSNSLKEFYQYFHH